MVITLYWSESIGESVLKSHKSRGKKYGTELPGNKQKDIIRDKREDE